MSFLAYLTFKITWDFYIAKGKMGILLGPMNQPHYIEIWLFFFFFESFLLATFVLYIKISILDPQLFFNNLTVAINLTETQQRSHRPIHAYI